MPEMLHSAEMEQIWLIYYKRYRWYFLRTSMIVSGFCKVSLSSLRWRKCGMTGDHSHIFWEGPVLEGFWQRNWPNNENYHYSRSCNVSSRSTISKCISRRRFILCILVVIGGKHFQQNKMDSLTETSLIRSDSKTAKESLMQHVIELGIKSVKWNVEKEV